MGINLQDVLIIDSLVARPFVMNNSIFMINSLKYGLIICLYSLSSMVNNDVCDNNHEIYFNLKSLNEIFFCDLHHDD